MKALIAITAGIFVIATGCNNAPKGSSPSVPSSNDRVTDTTHRRAIANDDVERSDQANVGSKTATQAGKQSANDGSAATQRSTQKQIGGAETVTNRVQGRNAVSGRGSLISPPTLAAGTSFTVQSESSGIVRRDQRPDTISANVLADVKDSLGRVVIPAGAKVKMTLVNPIEPRPDSLRRPAGLVFRAFEITIEGQVYPIMATSTSVDTTGSGRRPEEPPLVRLTGLGRGPLVRDEGARELLGIRMVLTLDRAFTR